MDGSIEQLYSIKLRRIVMSTFVPTTGIYPVTGALPVPFWRAHLLPVAFGCALLALFSKISIPLTPVPVSLQTVAVMLIGLLYTRANAIQSVATYLALGALGLPVFASANLGLPAFIGPTGGYLLGFIIAVALMTFLRDKWFNKSTLSHHVLLCTIGTAVVFTLGVSWLACLIGLEKAITVGVVPFLFPAVVKIAILTSLIKLYRTLVPHKAK
jgi:biotin transport system substrate-specific component